jgi:hypothetical protein
VNRLDHAIQVLIDIVHSELQDPITIGLEPSSPAFVISPLGIAVVRWSIDLDHQSRRGTVEINKVRPDRMLPPEFPTVELSAADAFPDAPLGLLHGGPSRRALEVRAEGMDARFRNSWPAD